MAKGFGENIIIGIASSDGKNINEHLGQAKEIYIYQISGNDFSLIEKREIKNIEGKWELYYEIVKDCSFIFAAKAGTHPINFFAQKGIRIVNGEGDIEKALKGFIKRRPIIERMEFGIGNGIGSPVNGSQNSGCNSGGCGGGNNCLTNNSNCSN